jgi:hypothetical protein
LAKTRTIENLFLILHYISEFLVVLSFLIFFKQLSTDREVILLAIYALTDLILNFSSDYLHLTGNWYFYIWSTFTLVEYSVFTFILWKGIESVFFRRLILVTSSLFFVFIIIFNIVTNFKNYDSVPMGIETILIFIYAVYYLYEQMNDVSTVFIYSKYKFWVVIGFLIYLAGSFFIFIFASGIKNASLLNQFWSFTNVFFAIMNVLFLIAFYLRVKELKAPVSNNKLKRAWVN